MGVHQNVGLTRYPKQGQFAGKRAEVCFDYDTRREKSLLGTIIRDDVEEPFLTVIKLDDGRVVMGGECQYNPFDEPKT